MAATHDFPSDLRAGQEELHQVRAELLDLLKRLPWSVAPMDGISDTVGRHRFVRPASPGWTADEQAQVEKLRRRERELAVLVSCHRYWSELPPGARVDGRMALKHTRDAEEPAGPSTDAGAPPAAPDVASPGTPPAQPPAPPPSSPDDEPPDTPAP